MDEQELGELVRDDPVDLLGHRAVEAPQPRLDMRVRHTELDEHERGRERRVDVAGHEREVGWIGGHDPLEPLHRAGGLLGMRARSDVEPMRRLREAELVDEELRELRVVVLTRVDDDVLGVGKPSLQLRDDRRHLDEVRPRPDDVEKSPHWSCLIGRSPREPHCQ